MKILLLNGPPRSGKDTLGKMLQQILGPTATVLKFANPLKVATHAVMAILSGTNKVESGDAYEDSKDLVMPEFLGVTPRQAYIALSEQFCKPLLGPGIFGEVLNRHLETAKNSGCEYAIVTDCGFESEAEVVVDQWGPDNVFLVTVARPGCNFSGDSRNYIDPEALGIVGTSVWNSGTQNHLRGQAVGALDDLGVLLDPPQGCPEPVCSLGECSEEGC